MKTPSAGVNSKGVSIMETQQPPQTGTKCKLLIQSCAYIIIIIALLHTHTHTPLYIHLRSQSSARVSL